MWIVARIKVLVLAYYYFREAHATHASPVDPPVGRVTGENSKNVHGNTA